jgi:acetyltransferase-like isoleucine patch superfamily enzyme
MSTLVVRRSRSVNGLTSEWAKSKNLHGVTVGRGTYGEPEIIGVGRENLVIGSFVSIASGVTIILANHVSSGVSLYPFRNVDWEQSSFRPIQNPDLHAESRGPVRIGHDVWLGKSATVLPGVSIGDGAIVGANAVVVRDVPPYGVVVGNPGKLVKLRLNKEQIKALLEIRWWDWDADFLKAAEDDFFLVPDQFIAKYHKGLMADGT